MAEKTAPRGAMSPLWHQALERYRDELNENDDYQMIVEEGFSGAFEHPEAFETLLPRDSGSYQSMSRLTPVLSLVDDFSAAIAVCFGADARLTAFVWGSIRLILRLASPAGETMQEVVAMLDELSLTLPRFQKYEVTLPLDQTFEKALIDVYTEVICFYARTIHFFRIRPHGVLRRRAWPDINGDFKRTTKRIKHLSDLVEREAERTRMKSDQTKYEAVLQVMDTVDINNSSANRSRKIWQVPRQGTRFFRGYSDAITSIEHALDPCKPGGSVKTLTVYGLGGVGKTEIALQYATKKKEAFGAVIWISANDTITIGQGFRDAAAALGLVANDEKPTDSSEATVRVKHWLAETDVEWLVIFDNADDPSLLKYALPTEGSGSVLVTSRDPTTVQETGSLAYHLRPFDEATASSLFVRILGIRSDDAAQLAVAQEIVAELGSLPLALVQVAGFIAERSMPLKEFLPFYRRNSARIDARKSKLSEHNHALTTLWSMSIEGLDEASSHLAKTCCLLNPDSIHKQLLLNGSLTLGSDKFLFMQDEFDLSDAEVPLLRASLMERNDETGMLSMHRLVQAAILRRMTAAEHAEFCQIVTQILTWGFPEHYSEDQGSQFRMWERCELCIAHALHLSAHIRSYNVKLVEDNRYAELLLRCSWYLYEREIYDSARQLVHEAINSFTDKLSKQYLNAVDLLGLIDLDMAQPIKALEAFQEVLDSRRARYADDEAFIAFSLNNLGIAYTEVPDLDKAYQAHEEAMSIRLRTESPRVGNSYSNMSALLLRMGKPDEAEEMLKRCPALQNLTDDAFIATGNPRVSGDMVLLSRIRLCQGRKDDALRLASKALKFRQDLLGNRLKTCDSLYDVANFLHLDGHAAAAANLLNELITIARSLPEGTGQLARAHYKLAVITQEAGRRYDYEHHKNSALRFRELLRPGQQPLNMPFEEKYFNELCLWMLWDAMNHALHG